MLNVTLTWYFELSFMTLPNAGCTWAMPGNVSGLSTVSGTIPTTFALSVTVAFSALKTINDLS